VSPKYCVTSLKRMEPMKEVTTPMGSSRGDSRTRDTRSQNIRNTAPPKKLTGISRLWLGPTIIRAMFGNGCEFTGDPGIPPVHPIAVFRSDTIPCVQFLFVETIGACFHQFPQRLRRQTGPQCVGTHKIILPGKTPRFLINRGISFMDRGDFGIFCRIDRQRRNCIWGRKNDISRRLGISSGKIC